MKTQRQPTAQIERIGETNLAYYDWPAASDTDEAPMIVAHATGFHGRCYDAIIEHFANRRVIALDLRGHGRSEGGPIKHWRQFSDDVVALLDRLQITHAIGVGHSMGAHTLLQSAADNNALFSRLVLFDPVVLAPDFYGPDIVWRDEGAQHPSIRRKRDFASPQAMMDRFASREPYSLFERRVFEDYCRHGLMLADNGGYELACTPEMEASVYMASRSNVGIHDAARAVEIPVLVVRAQQTTAMDFKGSPTWPELAKILPRGTDLHRPDRTHFHPFEDPAEAARIVSEFIA